MRQAEDEGEDSTDEEEFEECPKRLLAAGPQDNQVVIFMTDGSSPSDSSAISFSILVSFFWALLQPRGIALIKHESARKSPAQGAVMILLADPTKAHA